MNQNIHAASPELSSIEVENLSRSTFIMRGALAAGAAYGALAVGPLVRSAFAQGSNGDLEILNFALTLEYLEAAFYAEGGKQVKGVPGDIAKLVKTFGDQEQEHVDALTATIEDLGGKPVEAPGVDFGDAFASADSFLATAIVFEDLGVSAYNGAAPAIKSKDLLATAGGIVQIEARHAAAIRYAAGEPPAPEAFEPSATTDEVLKAVEPFLAK
ncbi:MAG: ferritin-like domain-containing protein [Actinomycetota bacterium]|nr:ferritin-like domain-containing protein [Actinomycetota bacterium]